MAGSIKEAFQQLAQQGMPALVVGIVESTSPICVVLKNDPKIRLSYVSLVIPKRITERKVCTATGDCCDILNGTGSRGCCIPKPIEVGEEFYMLSINSNKLYYVLDWK